MLLEQGPAPAAAPVPPARRRPELLAPAGDWECARAAVENGADAIYFGLERFNARMRAHNFTQADLPALMEFLHRRGVRGYVTFNTLVFANELAEAREYLRTIIAAGVDAAIVQDVGICQVIRELSPDFPIHCSTQMTITSAAGVEFARELGAGLVVLARENSLRDIAAIQAATQSAPLPLEVFVHGALCVAYSGQCLTSEALGGRSANRGECAQACRLPYELVADGKLVPLGDRRYLLSPQDLAGVDLLPQLVEAGVASLKIEGRLKSPEYVASVTRVYRAALDRVVPPPAATAATTPEPRPPPAAGTAGPPMDAAQYELEMSFSRGLYTGWFRGTNNRELVHARFGTKRGVFLGEIAAVADEAVTIELQAPVKPGDGVVFDAGRPDEREEGGRIYEVAVAGALHRVVLRFGRGDIDWRRVKAGQRVWKTNDPALDRDVRTSFREERVKFQRPLAMTVHGHAGASLTLIAHDNDGHVVKVASAVPLEAADRQPLTAERLREQLGRLGGTPFRLGAFRSELEGSVILPVSELNRLRREAIAQLEASRARPKRWTLVDAGAEDDAEAPAAAPAGPMVPPPEAELIAVIRRPEQLEAVWQAGVNTVYAEFENPKHYRESVQQFRRLQAAASDRLGSYWAAPPRIFKPGEEWILQQVRSCAADGYLVRNYDHLKFFAAERKRGDFSLNIANPVTAEYFLRRHGLERVTASYDLNIDQLEALLATGPAAAIDITIHQHMPMFHMEHCVFCAFLSTGSDYRDCGRPCDRHEVALRDRVGADLPLKADAGCRNTVFNNRAQTGAEYLGRLRQLGARSFRIEFVNEGADEVATTLGRYVRLLRGEITGAALWRELKLINQLGVTRGQLDAAPQVIARKS